MKPDPPGAPLDVVVMVKSQCDRRAGATCPYAAEQGLSSSSFLLLARADTTYGAHFAEQVMSVVLHTCPGGLTLFNSMGLHEGCKVDFVFLLL